MKRGCGHDVPTGEEKVNKEQGTIFSLKSFRG